MRELRFQPLGPILLVLLPGFASFSLLPWVEKTVTLVAADVDVDDDSGGAVSCPIGFGRAGGLPIVVPRERINDGYCDCPTTGEDEPLTSACSGIEYWAGRTPATEQDDDDTEDDDGDDPTR